MVAVIAIRPFAHDVVKRTRYEGVLADKNIMRTSTARVKRPVKIVRGARLGRRISDSAIRRPAKQRRADCAIGPTRHSMIGAARKQRR